MLGQILWFDDLSGDGMVGLEDGSSAYMHWSSIQNGDEEERFVNGKKKMWKSVKAGYIGNVKMIDSGTWRQVDTFKVTERKEPKKRQSMYIDREHMKARLVACNAEFDELFPEDNGITDKWYALNRKIKPTKKDLKDLEILNAAKLVQDKLLKQWNKDKSAAIVAIYREHSRFEMPKKGD